MSRARIPRVVVGLCVFSSFERLFPSPQLLGVCFSLLDGVLDSPLAALSSALAAALPSARHLGDMSIAPFSPQLFSSAACSSGAPLLWFRTLSLLTAQNPDCLRPLCRLCLFLGRLLATSDCLSSVSFDPFSRFFLSIFSMGGIELIH